MKTKAEQEETGQQDGDQGDDLIESKAAKKTEDKILKCPSCGSTRLREQKGDLICQECGLVVDEDRVKEDAGPRAFTAEERQKKERTGSPVTFTEASRGLRTKIGRGSGGMSQVNPKKRGQYYRMRKWNQRLDESKDRRMKFALGELDKLVGVLGLPDSVTEEAARLYEKALEQEVVKGRKIEAIVAALIYIVSRNQRVPRTMAEIAEEADVSERDLGKTYRYVARELDLRIVPVNPEDFIPRYSSKLGISGETQARARKLIRESREEDLLAGRSPDSIAASVIYLASILEGEDLSQKEVAEEVGVTEVTIRKGYSNLVEGLGLEEELE